MALLNNQPPELSVSSPFQIVYLPDAPREVILKEIVDTNVLISRSETDVDATLLKAGKDLRLSFHARCLLW